MLLRQIDSKRTINMRSTDQSGGRLLNDDLDELLRLDKQDPAKLTPSQKKRLDEGRASFVGMLDRSNSRPKVDPILVAPREGFQYIDLLDNLEVSTSLKEQEKQTLVLAEIEKELKSQSLDHNADILRLIEPRYNREKRILTFSNIPIRITADSEGEIICKRMFRNGHPVKNPVNRDEIIDLLGYGATKKDFYNKVAALNRLIKEETGAEKLFDYVDKKLWFNTKYVRLPL